jgi:hypothetical protein
MWIARTIRVLITFLACTGISACSGSDGNDDSSSDTDADTDTDTDSDTGTYPFVECEAEPTVCDDIGLIEEDQFFGCCFDNMVWWCEDGVLDSLDCSQSDSTCGYNSYGEYMDCIS